MAPGRVVRAACVSRQAPRLLASRWYDTWASPICTAFSSTDLSLRSHFRRVYCAQNSSEPIGAPRSSKSPLVFQHMPSGNSSRLTLVLVRIVEIN